MKLACKDTSGSAVIAFEAKLTDFLQQCKVDIRCDFGTSARTSDSTALPVLPATRRGSNTRTKNAYEVHHGHKRKANAAPAVSVCLKVPKHQVHADFPELKTTRPELWSRATPIGIVQLRQRETASNWYQIMIISSDDIDVCLDSPANQFIMVTHPVEKYARLLQIESKDEDQYNDYHAYYRIVVDGQGKSTLEKQAIAVGRLVAFVCPNAKRNAEKTATRFIQAGTRQHLLIVNYILKGAAPRSEDNVAKTAVKYLQIQVVHILMFFVRYNSLF